MARYNKFNTGIKLNHKVTDGGGIFNYRVFGIVGSIMISFAASAKPHLLKTTSAVSQISVSVAGSAKRTFHRAAESVITFLSSATAKRTRHSGATVNMTTGVSGIAKRRRLAAVVVNIVFGLIARLRQAYRPVYPSLSFTEYPAELLYTEYPMEMEVLGMPKAGFTITLQGTFPDSAGNLAELEDVTAKVHGPGRVLLREYDSDEVTRVSEGVYTVEYTIPEDTFGLFDYEFSGTLGNKTVGGRDKFDSNW
jgi:hypothetical protein